MLQPLIESTRYDRRHTEDAMRTFMLLLLLTLTACEDSWINEQKRQCEAIGGIANTYYSPYHQGWGLECELHHD